MSSHYHQGLFTPTNPAKYIGKLPIHYRSSWELKAMCTFDTDSRFTKWASESVKIPYRNPFTGKFTVYIPDFIVSYIDANGKEITEIIEIKPIKETFMEKAKSNKNKAAVILNAHKWAAAQAFAEQNGVIFRVMNEDNIYHNPTKR